MVSFIYYTGMKRIASFDEFKNASTALTNQNSNLNAYAIK